MFNLCYLFIRCADLEVNTNVRPKSAENIEQNKL